VSREGDFQQTLQVQPFNLVAPAFGCEVVEMSAKVPSPAQRGDTEACPLGSSLDALPILLGVFAGRAFRVLVLDPLLATDVVLPDRVLSGWGFGVVGVLAAVEPEGVVRGVQIAKREGRWTVGLGQAGERGVGRLP
jgi:hypothetical protein